MFNNNKNCTDVCPLTYQINTSKITNAQVAPVNGPWSNINKYGTCPAGQTQYIARQIGNDFPPFLYTCASSPEQATNQFQAQAQTTQTWPLQYTQTNCSMGQGSITTCQYFIDSPNSNTVAQVLFPR